MFPSYEGTAAIDALRGRTYSSEVEVGVNFADGPQFLSEGAQMGKADRSGMVALDLAAIPQRRLYTGASMPAIGLGTFGSDHVTPIQVADAVKGAAAAGYRHFDCASVYGNEPEVGASLEAIQRGGVKREELWITSKLWNDKHGEEVVIASCRQSLGDLRLGSLDLYLAH